MTTCACAEKSRVVRNDDRYGEFLTAIWLWFEAIPAGTPLFTTDRGDLWDVFLRAFPDDWRQYFNCHACKRFVDTYGGLVTLDEDGVPDSAVWPLIDTVPSLYQPSVAAVRRVLRGANVTGVFLSSALEWGQETTGVWHHMSVRPDAARIWRRATQTAGQARAEKREDYQMLQRALGEFSVELVGQALTVLKSDALYRSEKVLGVAAWLYGLQVKLEDAGKNGRLRNALTWQAVATAPTGFCHVRTSMIGTLLDDLRSGLPFDEVSERFRAKMSPLQYQRPQALPKAGNIAAAEKIIEQLQAAGALDRRFARLDELQTIWTPKPVEAASAGGVFAGVRARGRTKAVSPVVVSTATLTWVKFRDTVLPTAEKIQYLVPRGRANYLAFLTAINQDAPPILQWDTLEARNPVSWYVYGSGSPGSQWHLIEGEWRDVRAVVLQPSMWHGKCAHQGESATFVLADCYDTMGDGIGLFPEILKSEFHGIRATLEAYSRGKRLANDPQAAAGICVRNGAAGEFRVTSGAVVSRYRIDRWD